MPMERAVPYGFLAPVAVQYRTRAAGLTVMCVGDSITRGRDSRSHYAAWGLRLMAALSRPDRPVAFVNAGHDGAPAARFHRAARALLPVVRPDVLVIAPLSPNDHFGGEQARPPWQHGFALALDMAHDAVALGCLPVLTTPLPWRSMSSESEAARQAVIAELRGLAAQGVPVWDFAGAMVEAGTPPRLRDDLSLDGIHPNDRGHAAMARVADAGLSPILREMARAGRWSAPPAAAKPHRADRQAAIERLEIRFATGGNGRLVEMEGWSEPEVHGRWSDGRESRIILDGMAPATYHFSLVLAPFILPPIIDHQVVGITVNGRAVWTGAVRETRAIDFVAPVVAFTGGHRLEIGIACPLARAPISVSNTNDTRLLGVSIWNLVITRADGARFPTPAPRPVTLAPERPRVAVVTAVERTAPSLPIWLRHYAGQVGAEHCYVIDHGADNGGTAAFDGCTILRLPATGRDPGNRVQFNALFCASMTHWYDRVIFTEVDELLLADPKVACPATIILSGQRQLS